MAKHTPGPWIVGKNEYGDLEVQTLNSDVPICDFYEETKADRIRNKLNARLIAVAPEMLELLLEIREAIEPDYGSGSLVRAIDNMVEKATKPAKPPVARNPPTQLTLL